MGHLWSEEAEALSVSKCIFDTRYDLTLSGVGMHKIVTSIRVVLSGTDEMKRTGSFGDWSDAL